MNQAFAEATCYGVQACQAVVDPGAFIRGFLIGVAVGVLAAIVWRVVTGGGER